MSILIYFVVFTLIAFISPQIIPGIKVKGLGAAAAIALVFGLLNLLIGWLLKFILNLLTLWLLEFIVPTVINTLLLRLTDAAIEPFRLDGWLPALGMGFLFALGGWLAGTIT